MTKTDLRQRRAGLLVPLFSCPSTTSWGIGDIGDIAPMTGWLAGAGQRVLQLLPLNEMATGQQSPYSAISAMAIDPIYIRLPDLPDFVAVGGETGLSASDRSELARVRGETHVDYATVRRLKNRTLRLAFDRFYESEWMQGTDRRDAFQSFLANQAWWVEDYAIFRALLASNENRSWNEWPEALRRRDPAAIDQARRELTREVLFYQYLQWIADAQWQKARESASAHQVALFGDLPFMVDGNSVDVWVRQRQFRLDASVGVPPDAFSAEGQDWGMPVYRWDVLEIDDYRWLRGRARRSADLFDGYRVDHLVGFYRTYGRPHDGSEPFFTPGTEPEQIALGERLLKIFGDAGAEITAEDLGTVPDFVRASLARHGVPGVRVFRWERDWHAPGHPFLDPSDYAPRSVAVSGTHDTPPQVVWWEEASDDERRAVASLPMMARISGGSFRADRQYTPATRDALLEAICASGSDLALIPIGDVFGWRDRINVPATTSETNWTFQLPWPSDRLDASSEARERKDTLRLWSERHRRL
jgi:4-alpha-glucanotransferase